MPSSPSYRRNYTQERKTESKQRKKFRGMRNAARQKLMKEGKVRKGDNRDVDHKRKLSKGGSNKRSNLRTSSRHANRSFARTKSGKAK